MPGMIRHRGYCRWLLLASIYTLLAACAAVKPLPQQPFSDYQQSIAQLKDHADQALQQAAAVELDQYKASIAAGDNQKLTALMLQFPPQLPFGWCYSKPTDTSASAVNNTIAAAATRDTAPPVGNSDACGGANIPTFAAMTNMQQTLAAMNTLLLDYASTLTALSGADDKTQFNASDEAQRFDQQATVLAGQLNSLGVNTSAVTAKRLALFSSVAANLAENYLENKRKDLLAQVLSHGLEPLQHFVDYAQQAIDITAQNAKTQYLNEAFPVLRAVVTASGGGRQAPLDHFLTLNQNLQQQLQLLQSINNAYGALPNAQRQLIAALNQNRGANLAELIVYANSIRQQYEALKNSNSAASSPPSGNSTDTPTP